MDVAGDLQRDAAHASARDAILRQQRRVGVRLVQVFDDRQRLREHGRIVHRQRRHQALRIQREIILRALIAHAQVHVDALVGHDALEVQRDANAVGRGRAEVIIEFHEELSAGQKAEMPVCARPRISAWMSCVPS